MPGVPRSLALLFSKPFLSSSSRSLFHWIALEIAWSESQKRGLCICAPELQYLVPPLLTLPKGNPPQVVTNVTHATHGDGVFNVKWGTSESFEATEFTRGRACNLLLRRQTPYPLRYRPLMKKRNVCKKKLWCTSWDNYVLYDNLKI